MDVLRDETRKARKEYQCIMCGLRIEKGETHHAQVNIDCGLIHTVRSHTKCHNSAIENFNEWDWEEFGNQPDHHWFRTEVLGLNELVKQ